MMLKVFLRLFVCFVSLCLMWAWGYWEGKSRLL